MQCGWAKQTLTAPAARWVRFIAVRTDLKANLGGGDDTILSSMETGDSYAKERYDKYIKSAKLPDDILGTIRNQAQTIVGTLDRVRAMRQHRQVQSEAA